MFADAYPGLFDVSGDHRPTGRQVGWMLAVSLGIHLCLLLLANGLRFSSTMERPLSSYQVSIVSLPAAPRVETQSVTRPPAVKPVPHTAPPAVVPPPTRRQADVSKAKSTQEPPPPKSHHVEPSMAPPISAIPPVPQAREVPPPVPPPKALPVPQSRPAPVPPIARPIDPLPVPVPVTPPRKALDRNMLRGITLPPEAPKLDNVTPAAATPAPKGATTQTHKDIEKVLSTLTVPDAVAPVVPSRPQPAPPVPQVPARPSVSDELRKELQDLEQPVSRPAMPARPLPTPAPSVAMKTSVRNPATAIQAHSSSPGSNRYLMLVQRQISGAWVPPQVDPAMQSFHVIVRFRLHRNGIVQEVLVEQTSGNEYYDMAGKRAVLSARLPAFPAEMSDQYLDAHFSFIVGGQS